MKKLFWICVVCAQVCNLFAQRPKTVFLVQHTHTDIGYTRPQAEILAEHLRYIDFALEYCALTDDYPDEAKFRWTCEAAWTVSEYLKARPKEQVEKLLARIREGRIEVTAMYFNMAEIADETALRYFLTPLRDIRARGVPVRTAMQNDVNGIAWVLADYLHDLGVECIWTGSNAARAVIPFSRPTVCRWESPAGNGLVFYRGEHYMTANMWGVLGNDLNAFERKMNDFLGRIEGKCYPFDALAIQYSGHTTDNAAPTMRTSDFIRKWNASHKSVKLVSATASQFIDHLKASGQLEGIPVQRAAYPDWWTDGFGTAARETGESRKTQIDFAQTAALFAMARLKGIPLPADTEAKLQDIQKDQLFYSEHTFGASTSIRDPSCWNTQMQWGDKAAFAWTAKRNVCLLKETADGLLQGQLARGEKTTLTLFNPQGERRSGYAEVFIDDSELPLRGGCKFVGPKGESLTAWRHGVGHGGAYYRLFADDLPAFGYRTYEVVSEGNYVAPRTFTAVSNKFESARFRVTFDLAHSGILSIWDKELKRELVDPRAPYALGEIVFEQIKDRNRPELAQVRQCPENAELKPGIDCDLFTSVRLTAETPASDDGAFSVEVRLMKKTPTIELVYSVARKLNVTPCSFSVAFPFAGKRVFFDVPGGDVVPGVTQIEGSASDWNTVQNYVAAFDGTAATFLSMPSTPLVQFGRLWNGRFNPQLRPCENAHVFSWVQNNYWWTNFRASQEGRFEWRYTLTSVKDATCADALRFGRADRTYFPTRLMPKGKANGRPREWSGLKVEGPVILTGVQPAASGKGVVLQVRFVKAGEFAVRGADGKPLALRRIDATEHPLGPSAPRLSAPASANLIVLAE